MKLINFHNTELSEIRKNFWIELQDYKANLEWKIRENIIIEKIDSSTVNINKNDNTITNIDWERIIVYMRDCFKISLEKYWLPKIHFYNCKKIKEMIEKNQFDSRYVWAYTNNWKLTINTIDINKNIIEVKKELELKICNYCLEEAKKDETVPKEVLEDFSLKKYFDFYEYFRNRIKSPKYNFITITKNTYPKNWEEISKIERKRVNYICQWCKKDFSKNKYNLHVHHKDHNKWNNFTDNFEVLCYDCHSKYHEHMKK